MAASAGQLPGNLLSLAAQSNEGALAWTSLSGSSSITLANNTSQAFEGSQSLAVTCVAPGTYWVYASQGVLFSPGTPYVMSCYVWGGATAVSMGYNQGGTLVYSQVTDAVNPTTTGWSPLAGSFTNYPTTGAGAAVAAVGFTFTEPGQVLHVDLAYLAQTDSQILVDWVNPAFAAGSVAGSAFMDMTPFVNVGSGGAISMSRGRQDSIDDVQNGTLSFTADNMTGWFTPGGMGSPLEVSLGARVQWNVAYPDGAGYSSFVTRFDGSLNEIDYTFDPTGAYATADFNAQDVIGYLSNQPDLASWTKQAVLLDQPDFHWTLDDPSGSQFARETSGNNGPSLVVSTRLAGGGGDFGQSSYGVETMADSPDGTVTPGPYSTPVPGWGQSDVPTVTSGTAGAGSTALVGRLPTVYPIISDNGWSLEWWATYDPAATDNYATTNTARMGMVSLSDGTSMYLIVEVQVSTASTQSVELGLYSVTGSWAGTVVNVGSFGTAAARWNANAAVPFHYVLTCSPAGTFVLWENGVPLGTVTPSNLSSLGQAGFNQIVVGDGYGTTAAGDPVACGFPGSVSLVSLYPVMLNGPITEHYQVGQAGLYGYTAGAVVEQIASYAGLPPFWAGPAAGLSNLDYFPLNGQNALTAMQQAEQAEQGLLYANAAGQLVFASRAARMAAGGPDLVLPAGSFTADLGAKVTTQYVQTSSAIQGNASTVVALSDSGNEAQVGSYTPNGAPDSPLALPLLTYAPANPVHGQAAPYAQDIADWNTNVNSIPTFKVSTLTIDVLTLDDPASPEYVAPAAVAGLDINDVVSLDAAAVAALPGRLGGLDFFVEGVSETYQTGTHTIQLYTSPANVSRCWVPGDPVYGVLGSTAVAGVAEESQAGAAGAVPGTPVVVTLTSGATWVAPADIDGDTIQVECWGGGGGGSNGWADFGGGGGGGYARESSVPVVAGEVCRYTVGSGGAGGAGNKTATAELGADGGTTTFTAGSTVVSAGGGASAGQGGTGGFGTFAGGNGGISAAGRVAGAGGGGSAGTSAHGNNGTSAPTGTGSSVAGAAGAAAVTGGGAGGKGGQGNPGGGGAAGGAPGGGGGQGGSTTTGTGDGTSGAGGKGGNGQIRITYTPLTYPPSPLKQNTFDPGGPWFAPDFTATMNQGETASGFVGASDLRGITTQLQTMLNPPVFVAGQQWSSGGPVIAEGSWVNLPLSPIVDTWNGFNGQESTSSTWVVPVAGFYEICALFAFAQSPGDTTAWDNFYGRVVITDTRFRGGSGFQFCPLYLGEVNNAGGQMPGALYGRCRSFCGIGSHINFQGFQFASKPLVSVLLSAQFTGFSEVPD